MLPAFEWPFVDPTAENWRALAHVKHVSLMVFFRLERTLECENIRIRCSLFRSPSAFRVDKFEMAIEWPICVVEASSFKRKPKTPSDEHVLVIMTVLSRSVAEL